MGKTHKDDYWKKIRIPIPRPGHAMPSLMDYDRKRFKREELEVELLEEED